MQNAARLQSGFTLIEILLVLGLLAVIAGVSLVMGMDSYRGNSFRSDRDLLVAALEHARAESINAICLGSNCTDAAPHGVSIQSDSYVIFQGASYNSRDQAEDNVIPASALVSHAGLSDVVFSVLSATSTAGQIVLSDDSGHSSTITIGSLGQISWSN